MRDDLRPAVADLRSKVLQDDLLALLIQAHLTARRQEREPFRHRRRELFPVESRERTELASKLNPRGDTRRSRGP